MCLCVVVKLKLQVSDVTIDEKIMEKCQIGDKIHNKLYLLNLYYVEVKILVSFIKHAIPAHHYNTSTMQYIQGLKTSTQG